MGHLREKYTEEYFTGKDASGKSVGYGATLTYDETGILIPRAHDLKILKQINFKNKRVLGLGIGRGEELCYALQHGAKKYTGVDFSESAIKISSQLVSDKKLTILPKLVNEDALVFLKEYIKVKNFENFDIVIMFDFIEHVPRAELREIFNIIHKVLDKKGIITINTPAYKFDNDVIADGFDRRNHFNCLDTSDIVKATSGMHCNKYTVLSLQSFMRACGYENITEAHFFVKKLNLPPNFSNISFARRWNFLHNDSFPMKSNYIDDVVEYPYSDAIKLNWKNFRAGNLSGISLYVNEEYASIAYGDGNIDTQMIEDIVASEFPEDSVFFDIGAYVGVNSFVFAKMLGEGGQVIAFEPNEYNRNRFFLNLSHNPIIDRKIRVYPYALGDRSGKLKMNISANIDEGHSSTSRIQQSHSKVNDTMLPPGFFKVDVDVITLDEFVEKSGLVPNIMKIDIEGAEHIMLAGAIKTITKYNPVIYVEIHSEYCAIACYEIFSDLNYDVSVIHEEDDNRLMIKAIPNNIHKIKNGDLRVIENFNKILQNENIRLKDDNKRIQSKLKKLHYENEQIQSKLKKLHYENEQIQLKYQGLENSRAVRFANKIRQILIRLGFKKVKK